MRKNVFALCLSFACLSMYAQEEWIHINTDHGGEYNNLKEAIPVVDKLTGKFAFFLKESKGITAYYFDENQELVSEFRAPESIKKTSIFIGNSIDNNRCTLFFRNQNGRRFSSIQFNFDTNEYQIKEELNIDLKKELTINYFNDNDIFYLLSIVKGSSILKLYSFNIDSDVLVKTIDLSIESFSDFNSSFYNLFLGPYGAEKTSKVISGEPTSLEIASTENKAYFKDGIITLTTDFSDKYTYLVNINVKDRTHSIEEYENKNINRQELRAKSNSFIFDKYFFHVYSTTKRLVLDIYDRKTKNLVKELKIDEQDPISFINTPIILEGGDFKKYRELERNTQFLRKVTKSNLGVAVYKQNENYVLTIGSSEKIQQSQFVIMGGALGGFIGGALIASFNMYSKTKSTRVIGVFDFEYNHITGEVPLNGFDRINEYTKDFKRVQLESIFKHGDDYIWGCFYKSTGDYRFVKF